MGVSHLNHNAVHVCITAKAGLEDQTMAMRYKWESKTAYTKRQIVERKGKIVTNKSMEITFPSFTTLRM